MNDGKDEQEGGQVVSAGTRIVPFKPKKGDAERHDEYEQECLATY